MKEHLLSTCPPYCLADANNPNEKKYMCDQCWRVVGNTGVPTLDKQAEQNKEELKKLIRVG